MTESVPGGVGTSSQPALGRTDLGVSRGPRVRVAPTGGATEPDPRSRGAAGRRGGVGRSRWATAQMRRLGGWPRCCPADRIFGRHPRGHLDGGTDSAEGARRRSIACSESRTVTDCRRGRLARVFDLPPGSFGPVATGHVTLARLAIGDEPRSLVEVDASSIGQDSATVPLRVARAVQIDLRCVLDALDDPSWLGRPIDPPSGHPESRRIGTDLELPVLDRSGKAPIRKSVLIDLGPAQRVDGSILVDIAWRSANHAPLFPVFAGHLQISADRLALDGRYAPPFGKLGLLIDGALLHLVARRTAQSFLSRLAARCLAPRAAGN